MNKKFLLGIFALFFIASLLSFSSAYYYDGSYNNQYSVKEVYDRDGYSYSKRVVNEDPWGRTVTTKRIEDYDTPRGSYRYYSVKNDASDYFEYGPRGRNYHEPRHLGYGWDDSWRRDVYDSQYHPYYYEPRHNGDYWDWQYDYGRRMYKND